MNDLVFQIFWTSAVVTVIVALIEGFAPPRRRGLVSIGIGIALLSLGGLFFAADRETVLDRVPLINTDAAYHLVRDIACLYAGALFLGCGVVGRLSTGGTRESLQRLADTLGRTSNDLKNTQELLNAVVRSSISGVMILQAIRDDSGGIADFEVRLMNHEAEQILGRSVNTLRGQPLLKHVPCIRAEGFFQDAVSVVETKLPFRDERRCKHGDRERWYQVAMVMHGDGIVASFADVSDRKKTEEQLRHAAEHDTLTGLPSRSLLSDRLEQAINRAKRVPGYRFAVLFLDFDRFKIINDSLGHEVGDQLLISISERLRENLRDIDTPVRLGDGHLPARLGGDEFVVLLDGIQDARDAVLVAERLQTALSEPHMLDGHEVISTASIGIVTSDGNYERPDDILRDADTAMYQAKNSGKARHVVFDEKMHSDVMQRLNLEKELRQAADQLDFELAFQPIVSMETAQLAGFEALIRWPHSDRGTVLPANFIALAEELGLIVPIGQWVLLEACKQLATWQEQLGPEQPLSISVNLSRQQMLDPDLLKRIRETLKETGVPANSLVLEVTESTIMENIEDLRPVLERLHGAGIRLAMDDFGTGHSSLSFLHQVPMDILKIDRSFVNSPGNPRDYGAIVHTVVQLAHNLDMEVVAEGIETVEQLVLLQSLDCNLGQGYLFSKPVSAEKAGHFVSNTSCFKIGPDGTVGTASRPVSPEGDNLCRSAASRSAGVGSGPAPRQGGDAMQRADRHAETGQDQRPPHRSRPTSQPSSVVRGGGSL